MSWSELSSHCVPADYAAPPGAAVRLGTGANDDLREGAVLTLFSQGAYDGVRVHVGNDEIGVLTRDAVLEYMGHAHLGVGTGDGASLPGDPLFPRVGLAAWDGRSRLLPPDGPDPPDGPGGILQLWHCPVPGCPEPDIFIVGFDPNNPPTCAIHTKTFLKRVG
jgi:hypothetical protein